MIVHQVSYYRRPALLELPPDDLPPLGAALRPEDELDRDGEALGRDEGLGVDRTLPVPDLDGGGDDDGR
jgi:hypothetical protein